MCAYALIGSVVVRERMHGGMRSRFTPWWGERTNISVRAHGFPHGWERGRMCVCAYDLIRDEGKDAKVYM